jgi:hypothetical protein
LRERPPEDKKAAQAGAVIGLVVRNDLGQPDVKIELFKAGDTKAAHVTATKKDGTFEITDVPPGKYVARATGKAISGREPKWQSNELTVKPGEPLDVGKVTIRD